MRRRFAKVFTNYIKPPYLRLRQMLSTAVDRYLRVLTTDEAVADVAGQDIEVFRQTQRSMGWTGVWRIVRHVRPTADDVFLDIGCGAGRVACGVARRPLRRVVGIDLDPKMVELARRNVSTLRGRSSEVRIDLADAATSAIDDDVTLVFLYNPFGGAILRATLDRIVESIDRTPRTVRIIYANPKEPDAFEESGRFTEDSHFTLAWRPGSDWKRSQLVTIFRST